MVLRFASKLYTALTIVSAVSRSNMLTTDYTLLLEYQSGMVDFTSDYGINVLASERLSLT